MKKSLFFIAAMVAMVACAKVGTEECTQMQTAKTISIPMEMETVSIESDTKAYLNQETSGWNYVWEDQDQMGYFQFRGGRLYNQSKAEVDKRPNSVNVIYDATDFRAGDAIFSYLYQDEAEADINSLGITNNDPYGLYVQIPTMQVTSTEPETYQYSEEMSFTVAGFKYSNLKDYSISKVSNAIGVVPRSGKLGFKIGGYNSELKYKCTGASNLKIDWYGNATVDVNFRALASSDQTSTSSTGYSTTYSQVYPIQIYVEGYEDYPAEINLTVTATYKKEVFFGLLGSSKLTVSYAAATSNNVSVVIDHFLEGPVKPYPVRDCMPCVSKQLSLDDYLVGSPVDIQNNMTMYMLGSVVEFRVYSLDSSIAVGETLQGVIFNSTSGPCAGIGLYDLVGSDLTLGTMSNDTVIAYDADGKTIANGKENYVSLYMVLAPGTYGADVDFITDQNVYTFHMGAKEFSRAVKKAITCNLASTSCTVTPFDEFFGLNGGDETGTEGGEDIENEEEM